MVTAEFYFETKSLNKSNIKVELIIIFGLLYLSDYVNNEPIGIIMRRLT